jgi:DNA-binding PadR family transcriptional regulator
MTAPRLGRFTEPAMWVLVALHPGPRPLSTLLDDVRSLDGGMGPGTLFAALARLERLNLVEPTDEKRPPLAYRLSRLGLVAAGSVGALRTEGQP